MITPDGCAVELYARLPAWREPGVVHEAAGDGATILELGCGAGRVTHPLIELGHEVTAVDESPEMLARVRGARTVLARIQDLDLDDRRFDAVVLGSHLFNVPEDDLLGAWLATCRRHVADDGSVLIEHHPPSWFETVADGERTADGLIFRTRGVQRPGPGLLSVTVEYAYADQVWTQSYTAREIPEAGLPRVLDQAGLAFASYLTDDRSWFRAFRRAEGKPHIASRQAVTSTSPPPRRAIWSTAPSSAARATPDRGPVVSRAQWVRGWS